MSTPSIQCGSGRSPDKAGAARDVESEVTRLLSLGKCKQAVELVKDHHKKFPSADSQRFLVQAYVARIEQFQNKGMAQEAQTLLTLIQERFPAERHQWQGMEIRAAAASGRIPDLLRPLISDKTSAEDRALIETTVARHVTDLPAVASCDALPVEHPLRVGAAAVWRAFLAVTGGPVTDEQIALPEVSRRSPLAAWKMVIRAIAAFYRRDDEGCRRATETIPAESVVAPAAAVIRAMLDGKKPAVGMAAAVYTRVLAEGHTLRSELQKIEDSLRDQDEHRLAAGIRGAVQLCAQSQPELLERVRQHIYITCVIHRAPADTVRRALGSVPCNAYFWRLLAKVDEVNSPVTAAIDWERFLRHAVDEGLFSNSSAEAATIWLHIAELLSSLSLHELEMERRSFARTSAMRTFYADQPPGIARLRPESDAALADLMLEPGFPFQQAARIQADAETFAKWWAWAERVRLDDKHKEDIALHWQRGRPRDVQPLVLLSSLAESRNALSRALKWLGQAEEIDPLNQQVRQARVRLTLSIAWRHFADGKAHLVEKDLSDLAAHPSMGEGDRAAVLESMRGAWHGLRGDHAAKAECLQSVTRQMGPVAAPILFNSIQLMAGQGELPDLTKDLTKGTSLEIASAQARIIRLAHELNLKLWRPGDWTPKVIEALCLRPCPISSSDILLLGQGGVTLSEMELAYVASAAGLVRADTPAATARFLLLRARSLDEPWQRPRAMQCLRAALELARQAHDEALINEVFATIDRNPFAHRAIANAGSGQGMDSEVLGEVLNKERAAEAFPRDNYDNDGFVVPGALVRPRGGFDEFDDDEAEEGLIDDDESDEADDTFGPPGLFDFGAPPDDLSPEDLPRLQDILEDNGITSMAELMENPASLIEAMAKLLGKKVEPSELAAILNLMGVGFGGAGAKTNPSGHSFGEPKKKRNKRRRG